MNNSFIWLDGIIDIIELVGSWCLIQITYELSRKVSVVTNEKKVNKIREVKIYLFWFILSCFTSLLVYASLKWYYNFLSSKDFRFYIGNDVIDLFDFNRFFSCLIVIFFSSIIGINKAIENDKKLTDEERREILFQRRRNMTPAEKYQDDQRKKNRN